MFSVYQSNQLTVLLSKVCQIIQKKPLPNIFEKEIFIHDNKVLFQYLNIFIADKIGISTGFNLYHPNDFIWKLFRKFSYKKDLKNIFTHSIMTWKIMKILKENSSQNFYQNNNSMNNFKFSCLMAQIFEQYLLYRPNWINTWEKNEKILNIDANEKWQKKLWMEIINQTTKYNKYYCHFSNLFYLIQELIKKKIKKKDCPKRLFIISCFSLNPSYIKIFKKISPYIHIYFLYITPFRQNILHIIKEEKDFLKKKHKEYIFGDSLIKLWGKYEKIYSLYIIQSKKTKIITCFKKNRNINLLNNIKNDFFLENRLNTNKTKKKYFILTDNSISIHICFNKKHEIEILYEKLLTFFLEHPNIKAKDVVVTSFSIDSYIPYINSVFKSLSKKEQIPFFISKKFSKKTEIMLSSFNTILNLSNNRFKNEEILALLDIPEIAKNFDISEEEINILYNWIEETNIRWAIDEKHKDYLSFPKIHQNTWLYGIEKLLLSYAMNNTENIWNNVLSCSLINGSRTELLEKLIIFIKKLEKWQKKLSKTQNLIYWRSLSKLIINDFFHINAKTEESIQIIQKNWIEMIDDGLLSNYSYKISIKILQKKFINKYNHTNNQKFLPDVLNFCHPSAICYIPFKIICIIGADYQSTQSTNNMESVNFLHKYPLIGDVNIYQQYCYLFLQSISCTQEYFYISYVGYSIKDASKTYPSVLVDQLLNYIAIHYCLIGDKNLSLDKNIAKISKQLCTKYKQNYFYDKKNVNIFKKKLEKTPINIDTKKHNKNVFNKKELKKNHFNKINLIDLISFWKNPIRYFVKNTLKIKFNLKQQNINITEPFVVNILDSFKIRNLLLNKIINNQDTRKLFKYYVLSGKLPYKFFGMNFWNKNIKEINSIAKKVIQNKHDTEEKKICLKIQNYQINGILSEIQSTGLLRWKPSLINYSDRISLWLEHLIYSISTGCGESKIIGYKNQTWSFSPLKSDIAYAYLLEYIEGYIRGIKTPLFLIKSGACWLDQVYDKSDNCIKDDENIKRKAYKKLLECWIGNNYIKGEKKDFYINTIIKKLNTNNIKEICKIAKKWLIPILKNRKK